ncbi:CDP-glycerol glycerophosphotransferase family protein [Merdibacter massiliensis]|uniref:CDP-glycerol glycerophosphotransferase family protein n=1 Tax=Merdibacter massiliensis TaxID=1871030 RepID=UPI00096A898C|nr:CDP-glycerol glycerophosphotransferase family protein [Merdibacter massiliensis]
MYRILKKLITLVVRFGYRAFYKWIPCQKKTVLFIAFHGRGCLDNPKAIYEYLINDQKFNNFHFIWALKKPQTFTNKNTKSIRYLSLQYFFYLARSTYWISNCKLPSYILKKKNQIYLQTWHGTPLKKLAHDIDVSGDAKFYRSGLSSDEMKSTYDDDVKKYDYMIAPNSFCTKVFQSAFGIDKCRLIETGYPRNDILINADECLKNSIKKKLNIPESKKVILYAPTWRDNSFTNAGYTFELQADFFKWKKYLNDEYVVLFKPHYLIINHYAADKRLEGFLYNIDADAEISELYLIADVLITDYSSVFFDFAILKRPIYFYMYDMESYKDQLRGFYIDVNKDLPGKIYQEEEAMLKDIVSGTYDYSKLNSFNAYFNEHEDGKASKRVVDIVFKER